MLDAAASKRYSEIIIKDFVIDESIGITCSFTACVFELNKNAQYISFGGTNKSISSIYEDASMICEYPVKSQLMALEYVEKKCENPKIKYYLGGHSKGGNLALFAFVHCKNSIRKNIAAVYNNDGPGIPADIKSLISEDEMKKFIL